MALVKETSIGKWMQKLGRGVGILLFLKRKEKNEYTPPISEREMHNRILLRVMCGISRDIYETDWEDGLEYDLWAQSLMGMTEDGACLRLLSERASGWWVWSEDQNKPEFISMKNWSGHYNSWKRKWKTSDESYRVSK